MARVNLLTQAEYARHRGVSQVAVYKAVKAGRITLIDGKVDPAVADIQWEQNTRQRADAPPPPAGAGSQTEPDLLTAPASGEASASADRAAPPPAPGAGQGDDYTSWRARREAADAAMAEHRLAEERGKTIRVEVVRQVLANALSGTRDALMQIPARLAPVLSAESDPAVVHQLLEEEIFLALERVSTVGDRLTPQPSNGT